MDNTINAKKAGEIAVRNLSEKAQAFYDSTDPLTVYAHEDGSFTVCGVFEAEAATLDELDALFCAYEEE